MIRRFEKFDVILKSGYNLLISIFDKISIKQNTNELVQQMKAKKVITKDNAVIIISTEVSYKISDSEKAVYSIDNYELAVENIVATSLRTIIGKMELSVVLVGQEVIKASLKEKMNGYLKNWGLYLITVEVKDIRLSDAV